MFHLIICGTHKCTVEVQGVLLLKLVARTDSIMFEVVNILKLHC